MKKDKLRAICLTASALVLSAGMAVGSAMAYFTTYTTAEGGVTLELGFTTTEIEEKVVNGKKEIVLNNTGDYDCYVRLRVFTGDAYKDSIAYSEPDGAGKWTPGADGYYYYSDIVEAKESASRIDVSFPFPNGDEPEDFNVIIVQECTPVLLDAEGNPYADWSVKADVSKSIYKGEGE